MESDDAVDILEEAAEEETLQLADCRVAFVGRLEALNRRDARQWVREQGGQPAERPADADVIVVGTADLALDEWEQMLDPQTLDAAASGQVRIVGESRFWQLVGMAEPDRHVKRWYTAVMLARLLNVPVATIRRWHRRGLIAAAHHVHRLAYFDFHEVATARRLAQLIQSGTSPAVIEAKLSRLSESFPEARRPLSQLTVIVEGRDVLLRRGEGLVDAGGQKWIDFAALESPGEGLERATTPIAAVTAPPAAAAPHSIDDHRRWAQQLEEQGQLAEALAVYRAMPLAFGPSAEICFEIAELLYRLGDVVGARERYWMAIELDDQFVEARASLGCILLETGEPELAVSTFRGALAVYPEYADVHFHLGRALDDLDRPVEAHYHWQQFLALAPESPWAEEARRRLH